jgi:thymidine phosphorylase
MFTSALAELKRTIDSGAARNKLAEMVAAQGGNLDAPRPVAPPVELPSPRSGYVAAIDAERLGQAVIAMRGGRRQLGDALDHSTGFEMLVRLGDRVDAGQPLARVFAAPDVAPTACEMMRSAVSIEDDAPPSRPLILDRVA